jgi:hypothetical protein
MNEFTHRPYVKIHSHSPLVDSDAKRNTLGRFGSNDGRLLVAMADLRYGEPLTRELSIIIYYDIFRADVSNFDQIVAWWSATFARRAKEEFKETLKEALLISGNKFQLLRQSQ